MSIQNLVVHLFSFNIQINQQWREAVQTPMTAGNELLLSQGPHGPWKIWKVMEFKNCIFQVWKVTEFNCQSVKVMENLTFFWQISYCRSQSKGNSRQREMTEQCEPQTFRWTPQFVSLKLCKIQKIPKKWQLNLRSWKTSVKKLQKVLEFKELKRVQTLFPFEFVWVNSGH